MSRLKWVLLVVALVLVGALVVWLLPIFPPARQLLDRVRAAERRQAARVQRTKANAAALKAAETTARDQAIRHTTAANRAQRKAEEIERKREALLVRVSGRMSDEERARRFRERHGLADPRDR